MTEESTSGLLTDKLENLMKTERLEIYRINVRKSLIQGKTEADFEAMLKADALVFVFPLYVFCLPGMLMRFLQDYYAFGLNRPDRKKTRVYAVVNCGFTEAGINQEAVRVIKSFSQKTNYDFRFGIMIGGGGLLLGAQEAPFMKKTMTELGNSLKQIVYDIKNCPDDRVENISITMNFPRRLYHFMGNRGWFSMAKKNGLQKKDLYRKPYERYTD
ncbi:MAG: flavodoxin [Peptococcaceae bacterium]|nr:flavodoxin [Peptococcaceae bacterium]